MKLPLQGAAVVRAAMPASRRDPSSLPDGLWPADKIQCNAPNRWCRCPSGMWQCCPTCVGIFDQNGICNCAKGLADGNGGQSSKS
jgi:hypothetical protein